MSFCLSGNYNIILIHYYSYRNKLSLTFIHIVYIQHSNLSEWFIFHPTCCGSTLVCFSCFFSVQFGCKAMSRTSRLTHHSSCCLIFIMGLLIVLCYLSSFDEHLSSASQMSKYVLLQNKIKVFPHIRFLSLFYML